MSDLRLCTICSGRHSKRTVLLRVCTSRDQLRAHDAASPAAPAPAAHAAPQRNTFDCACVRCGPMSYSSFRRHTVQGCPAEGQAAAAALTAAGDSEADDSGSAASGGGGGGFEFDAEHDATAAAAAAGDGREQLDDMPPIPHARSVTALLSCLRVRQRASAHICLNFLCC